MGEAKRRQRKDGKMYMFASASVASLGTVNGYAWCPAGDRACAQDSLMSTIVREGDRAAKMCGVGPVVWAILLTPLDEDEDIQTVETYVAEKIRESGRAPEDLEKMDHAKPYFISAWFDELDHPLMQLH